MTRGIRCQAHRHTGVVAEERHHLQPQSRGGLTVAPNMRYLCANAHGDTHYLLDAIETAAEPLIGQPGILPPAAYQRIPHTTRRTYGPGVTQAALDGWARYGERFLQGAFVQHRKLWLTSGQPRLGATRKLGLLLPFSVATRSGVVDYWLAAATAGTRKRA